MDIKGFIRDFEDALEIPSQGSLSADTQIHKLPEMDSMAILSIIAMMHKKYQTKVKGADIKNALTINDLFNQIQSN